MNQRSHPTDDQIKRLYTLASKAGLNRDWVHDEILARYGIESTRDLSLRQYQDFTAFLERLGKASCKAGSSGSAGVSPASAGVGTPALQKLHSKADCGRLLQREWPEIFKRDEALAANLVEAIDCWRLTRLSGTLGEGIATTTIQIVCKADLRDVRRATAAYLTGYTTRGERYYLGMIRGAKRDRLMIERRQQRQAKDEKRKHDEIDGLAQDVLKRAGDPPSCPAGSAGVSPAPCPFCDGKSKLWYQPTEDAPFSMIPCPWCVNGRREMLAQIAGGKRFDHVNWRLVKEQLAERLRRRALESNGVNHKDTTGATR